jgi:hypothetical protein
VVYKDIAQSRLSSLVAAVACDESVGVVAEDKSEDMAIPVVVSLVSTWWWTPCMQALMYTILKDRLWTTTNAGATWKSVPLSLDISVDRIYFHPSEPDWLIIVSGAQNDVCANVGSLCMT